MRIKGVRYSRLILPLLLLSLASLIFYRHRRIEETGVLRWFDRPLILVVSPLTGGFLYLHDAAGRVFHRYFFFVGLERENERLRQEAEAVRLREALLSDLSAENDRLLKLTELEKNLPGEWVTARILSYPPIGPYRILTVNKGSRHGIRRRAPVVSTAGLVGQVARVWGDRCEVLLMTDPTSAVDGRLERTGARGLIVGKVVKMTMSHELFISAFEYLSRTTELQEGEKVVTSGLDGIYPPGISIGTVLMRGKKKFDIFQQADVLPAADFYNLREVAIQKTAEP